MVEWAARSGPLAGGESMSSMKTGRSKRREVAWEAWLRDQGPRFMLFARQQTRNEADAEDVLQNALLRTWKHLPDNPSDTSAGLVYTNIRRAAIDLARGQDRRQKREERYSLGEETAAWFALPDDDEARRLQVALAEIAPKFREVVTLKIWGELTFAQISQVLDIPLNTAASRYRNGLGALRRTLGSAKI